ncbi:hypothetical protein B4U84_09960 [Westiellopsis prolifica IICB1]|nr:hypothetical protein B4U84_09960 [Westiellopsis prolifica IICB1]
MKGKFITLTGAALTLALTSNIAAAQSTKFPELSQNQQNQETTTSPPEIKLSPEGKKILCEYFPLNSRCQGASSNTTTPDSTTPDSTTTPAPDSTTPDSTTTPAPDSSSPTQITPAPDSTIPAPDSSSPTQMTPAPDSTTPAPDSSSPTQITPGSGSGTGTGQ